jgi:hypothetical protein
VLSEVKDGKEEQERIHVVKGSIKSKKNGSGILLIPGD